MTTIEITEHAVGDDFDIERTVTGIPAGATLTKAWFMAKASRSDADDAAVISKEITTTLVPATGQITDTGAGDTAGEIVFYIRSADTSSLVAEKPYYFGIRVRLSTGLVDTLEWGVLKLRHAIVQATN